MTSQSGDDPRTIPDISVESISALTLATHEMGRAVRFYRALGFVMRHGGETSEFTTFAAGSSFLNLVAQNPDRKLLWWGRAIFYVSDVDDMYRHALAQGLKPDFAPRDGFWGERYFHITDPDGHELSFAKPLPSGRRT